MRRSDGRAAAAAASLVVLALAVSACGPTGVETVAAQGKAAAVSAPTPVPAGSSPASGPAAPTTSAPATPTAPPAPVIPSDARRIGVDSTLPNKTQTVGVGMPIVIMFNRRVPDAIKPAVQARAMVTTSKDIGSAGWAWLDDTTLAFRPRAFWPANTDVKVVVDLKDVYLGETAGKVYAGSDSAAVTFRIGRAMVSTVNLRKQMMTVRVDGKKVRSIPVSTGKAGWETRQGIKIIMERTPNKIFTSTAVGDTTEQYVLTARYALRVTWSGEFLHSAPWAYGRLGQFAGSHGCTNMTNSDAGWLYDKAYYGDPVIFDGKKSAPQMESRNGWGGLWNIGWSKWRAKSASTLTGWTVGAVVVGKAPPNKQVVYQNPDVVTSLPKPTPKPTPTPTPSASAKPTGTPTPSGSPKPSASPGGKPSPKPTTSPTTKPTAKPTSPPSAPASSGAPSKPGGTSSGSASSPATPKPAPTTPKPAPATSKPAPATSKPAATASGSSAAPSAS